MSSHEPLIAVFVDFENLALGLRETLDEMRTTGALDFATLAVAVQEIRQISRQ